MEQKGVKKITWNYMIKWFLCVGMLIVPNVAFSSKDNAWGKPGEAIRYHFISPETGDSFDLGFWPIDNELTKHVTIQNNNKSYIQFNRTRLIKNIRNKSLEDYFMSYYVVLYHCKKNDEFLSWNDCADRGHNANVIRRSTVGGFAVSWKDKHGEHIKAEALRLAKNNGAAFDASKYVFIQRDIEIVPATSRKAVDFEERSKKIYQQYLAQQQQKAAEERKIAQQREQEKKIIEAAKREAARLADDQEPTQSEMGAAIRRSTLAGALLDVSVHKIGACRKAASYDYYCRYRWFDVNWGNFWKQNGEWHFKIANQ